MKTLKRILFYKFQKSLQWWNVSEVLFKYIYGIYKFLVKGHFKNEYIFMGHK